MKTELPNQDSLYKKKLESKLYPKYIKLFQTMSDLNLNFTPQKHLRTLTNAPVQRKREMWG